MQSDWIRKNDLKRSGLLLDNQDPKKASDRITVLLDVPHLEDNNLVAIIGFALGDLRLKTAFGRFENPADPPLMGNSRLGVSIETKGDTAYQVFKHIERELQALHNKLAAGGTLVPFEGPVVEGTLNLEWICGGW